MIQHQIELIENLRKHKTNIWKKIPNSWNVKNLKFSTEHSCAMLIDTKQI